MDAIPFNLKKEALGRLRDTVVATRSAEVDEYGAMQWDEYKTDPNEYFFAGNREWKPQIMDFFDSLHRSGDKIVYLDICGTADGEKIGADVSYGFSLQTPANVATRPDKILIEGDVFSRKDFNRLIETILKSGDLPAFITFEPYAGIGDQVSVSGPHVTGDATVELERAKTRLAYDRLANNLRKIIEMLRPGGFLLVGEFFRDSQYLEDLAPRIPAMLRAIAEENGCSFEESNLDRYLIRKTSDTKTLLHE